MSKAFIQDITERALRTFIQVFIMTAAASPVIDIAVTKQAAIAGLSAVGALLMGLLAKNIGSPDSASVLGGE